MAFGNLFFWGVFSAQGGRKDQPDRLSGMEGPSPLGPQTVDKPCHVARREQYRRYPAHEPESVAWPGLPEGEERVAGGGVSIANRTTGFPATEMFAP